MSIHIQNVTQKVLIAGVGALRSTVRVVKDHPVSAVALGILMQTAYAAAGPLAYMACFAACSVGGTIATHGAFLPAVTTCCANFCAPVMLAPTP